MTPPEGEAIEFLRRTIHAHPGEITLLAIGPLTNIGLLFSVDTAIPGLLKQLVLMNGYFLAPDTYPEWNTKLDPHAAAIVYRSNVPLRTAGLDVTTQVTMSADLVRQRFNTPLLRPVLDFAEVWFQVRPEITFHDPLAAAMIFDDSICTFERGHVEVILTEGENQGRTLWSADTDGKHEVATSVRPERFFDHFFAQFV
jgi:purine nucleosidase